MNIFTITLIAHAIGDLKIKIKTQQPIEIESFAANKTTIQKTAKTHSDRFNELLDLFETKKKKIIE